MAYETPESIIARTSARLKEHMLGGQHYELAGDLHELLGAIKTVQQRSPTPEGWMSTANRIHPNTQRWHYVYHEAYGSRFAIYSSADWEDKKLWVRDWHGDFEFERPRFGWATRQADGSMALLSPQPSHYLPEPEPPTV
jgi:hypothetical protein